MQTALRVSVDLASITNIKSALKDEPVKLAKAVAGAINDTAIHEAGQIVKLIRSRVNIQKEEIQKNIGRTAAMPSRLEAVVTLAESARLPLKYFGARKTAKGITYRISTDGPAKLLKHAFIVGRLGGNVFLRKNDKATGKMVARLPIRKADGVSAWAVFLAGGGPEKAQADADAYLQNRLEHRLQYQK
jgi:hypothetical protein